MLLKKYNDIEIKEEVEKFYDSLANIFLKRDYNNGRYNIPEKILKELNSNEIDYDFLYFTEEGNKKQDKDVINYHISKFKEILENLKEYIEENIFIEENVEFSDGINIIKWDKIKNRLLNDDNFKSYEKLTNKSLKISVAGIISILHVFGINKTNNLLKNKKPIYVDSNLIPITFYIKFFEDYDISSIININLDNKIEKVVVEEKNELDKKELEKIKEKEEFFGQNSNESLISQIENISNNELLKKILKYLENIKNDKKKETKNNINENVNNYFENDSVKKNYENKKYITKYNKELGEKLKKEYKEYNYNENPYKYLENTTNKNVKKEDLENINEILKEYEDVTKSKDGIGKVIRQDGFNQFRNFEDKDIELENIIIMILMRNNGNELEILEKSLGKYSCKYIKESFLKRASSFTKNLFLTKVSDFLNKNLKNNDIDYNINLADYNYLEFGIKDIDDIKIKKYSILELLKSKNLILKSYSLDENGIRKFPRSRRLFDNILEEFFKEKINFKEKYFDNVFNKDENLVRNYIIFIDEKINGIDEKFCEKFKEFGEKFNITKLIYILLKNKIEFRNESLIYLSHKVLNLKYEKYNLNNSKSEDKKYILNIFPTYISLKKHLELKKILNIAYFFRSFYDEEDEKIKIINTIVTEDAILKCSLGEGISRFINIKNKIKIENKMIILEKNKEIIPFQFCSVCKVCVPNLISNWNNTLKLKLQNSNALLNNSTIMCQNGGLISISLIGKKVWNESLLNISTEKIEKEEKNIYQNKIFLENLLDENIFDNLIKNSIFSLDVNKQLFKKTLDFFSIRISTLLNSNMKAKIPSKENKYNIAVYDFDNKKIYNLKNIEKEIINYYLGAINESPINSVGDRLFKKYKKNINAKLFLKEFLIESENENKEFETEIEKSKLNIPWVKTLISEYNNSIKFSNSTYLFKKIIEYHKIGAGIDANKNTPWCASFANWVLYHSGMNITKTASSLSMKNNLKKISKDLYGALLILAHYDKNGKKTSRGHITFIMGLTENRKKYICLGGNQGGIIKYSKYNKNSKTMLRNGYFKVEGIYWPKEFEIDDVYEI